MAHLMIGLTIMVICFSIAGLIIAWPSRRWFQSNINLPNVLPWWPKCYHCNQTIRPGTHGIPSQWEHADTRRQKCKIPGDFFARAE